MNTKPHHAVDITIIGGGVAGCIAAIALAPFYSVVVIDKLTEPNERIGECLAPAARRILRQLNLLDGFDQPDLRTHQPWNVQNYGTQSYWGSEQVQVVDHLRNPDGFGWQLNRQGFEVYLRESAVNRGVTCLWGTKLHRAQYEALRWQLTVQSVDETTEQSQQLITAKFVIDASGRQSHFAKKLGIQRQPFDQLIACWATLTTADENKMSTISASENGWWYSSPLPNNKRVLAFQTDSDLIDRTAIKQQAHFLDLAAANPAISNILQRQEGSINYHGTVAANSTLLDAVVGQQWVALGDAAISFDPLSSQGMFNAMANAMQLTELLVGSQLIERADAQRMQQFNTMYSEQIHQVWTHYLYHKKVFYGQEQRWKDAEFWKRRQ